MDCMPRAMMRSRIFSAPPAPTIEQVFQRIDEAQLLLGIIGNEEAYLSSYSDLYFACTVLEKDNLYKELLRRQLQLPGPAEVQWWPHTT
jgi:hypothetical protein